MRFRRLAAIAPLALASLSFGQYDSIVPSSQPVITEGFQVLHDDGASLKVFSAFAQEWRTLAPTGSALIGSGDWAALALDGPVHYAYSARLDQVTPLIVAGPIVVQAVEDDMALIVTTTTAYAFSAHTGLWSSIALSGPVTPADVATSRFVAGIRDGVRLRGYASRPGVWAPPEFVTTAGPPQADGNTLLFNVVDPFGFNVAKAFSGVLGTWATTPILVSGAPLALDHNVAHAFVEGLIVGQLQSFGYSAYASTWTPNSFIHPPGSVVNATLSDNVVYTLDVGPGIHSAFGARPSLWDSITNPALSAIQLDEDHVTLQAPPVGDMHAFSGVCGGNFVTYTGSLIDIDGSRDHLGTAFEPVTAQTVGFSPALNAWSGPSGVTGPTTWDDAIGVADASPPSLPLKGYSTRYNEWIPGPALTGAPSVQGGSVYAVLDGPNAHVWNERCNTWNPPYAFSSAPSMVAGRNLVLCDTPTEVAAYSVQRQSFEPAPAAVALPINSQVTDENVAHFFDASGSLWAFGSAGTTHVWHAWPNGTEYTAVTATPTTLDFSIAADAGSSVFAYWSPTIFCPAIPTALGPLWLMAPNFLSLDGPLTSDDSHMSVPVSGSLPTCLQIWIQAVVVGPVSLTDHTDALWLF